MFFSIIFCTLSEKLFLTLQNFPSSAEIFLNFLKISTTERQLVLDRSQIDSIIRESRPVLVSLAPSKVTTAISLHPRTTLAAVKQELVIFFRVDPRHRVQVRSHGGILWEREDTCLGDKTILELTVLKVAEGKRKEDIFP
jgi:hypothetical protein